MSLFVIAAASAALVATVPHTVSLEHRGAVYQVHYQPRVETTMRAIGISAGARPSTQRCLVTVHVVVERAIAGPQGRALTSVLPGRETFTNQLPGDCRGHQQQHAGLIADRAEAIGRHLARTARADRQGALAAIDSAHHFATN